MFLTSPWSSIHPLRSAWILSFVSAAILIVGFPQRSAAQAIGRPITGHGHSVWTTRHGLPQNIVRALLQTRDGYLWLGTGSGLVRFDGVAFTVFEVAKTPGLPSNWISALHEDRDGTLWIGTDAGLVRYRKGQFSRLTVADDATDTIVSSIQTDSQGRVWVSTTRRVASYDGARWTVLPLGPVQQVSAVLVDRRDTVWIGTLRGVIQWQQGTMQRSFTTREGLPGDRVRALYEDRKGEIWIGTSHGVARIEPQSGTVVAERAPLADAFVSRVFEDRDGVFWFGGTSTLFARTRDGRISAYPVDDAANGAQISSLTQTREGQVWFGVEGGNGGLHRLSPRSVTVVAHEQGLPCDNVVPVTQGADGTVWLATHCGEGRSLVSIRDGQVRPRDEHPALDNVSALLADPDGSVWAGTIHGDLISIRNGRVTMHAYGSNRDAATIPGAASSAASAVALGSVTSFYRDPHSTLWIGTSAGLWRYQNGRFTPMGTTEGLVSEDVRSIVGDGKGALWIGTGKGLSRYLNGRFTNYTAAEGFPPGAVRAIHVDADGIVWAGTYGGGLCRVKGSTITRFNMQDGLLESTVHRILEDDRGYFWMSGNRGIRRVSRRELNDVADGRTARVSAVVYDENDGMKNAECNGMGQPAGWRMRDGSLWFPTQGGVVRIDPSTAGRDLPPPILSIEEVRINGRTFDPLQAIAAPAGAADLEVRYTAPAFARPEQMQFKYKLAGHDTDWVDAGTRRVAHYTNLTPGNYTFSVMARTSTGQWSELPTAPTGSAPAPTGSTAAGSTTSPSAAPNVAPNVAIVLQPRWYQQTMIRLAILIGGVAAVIALFRFRDARLRQRANALEEVVSQRTAELRDEQAGLNAANQELQGAKAALQTSHTQLLSVLDQLRIGVIIVNPRHEILFVSEATRRLLAGLDEDEVIGRPLDRILPIAPDVLTEVQTLVRDPRPGTRLTVQLNLRSGRHCWAELEVRLDPRDASNSILYLYDVTETYELKRVQDIETTGVSGAGRGKAHSSAQGALASLIGTSVPMRFVHGQIRTVAAVDATVLIEGETGTGKELAARAIHEASRRKDQPFVAINCAGLTESLLASQLFGHRRGAFTGAVVDHVGLFEAAQGGTLLLDEIGDMPMSVQTHLLRVLQEREILRLGDSKPKRIDVRLLVATHRNLEQEVSEGRFREDLLYRILVVRIAMPPLRQRLDDIPLLATTFMQQFCATHRKPLEGFSRDAMERLMAQRWPGNVRELRAAVEWAVIRASGPTIRRSDLPTDVIHGDIPPTRSSRMDEERRRLLDTLSRTGGNRSVAARLLGVSRATLYRRLAALDTEPGGSDAPDRRDPPSPPPADDDR